MILLNLRYSSLIKLEAAADANSEVTTVALLNFK
jgi:hypothetical protein